MGLIESIESSPEIVSHTAALLGLTVAAKEAADRYGAPENYPVELKEFLDRCVEVAEEFIDKLGIE